ncbi:MAG: DinB family protein [Planctomycetales bacterium]|nr:DinB family protein [Planctomycetales bacterium]
MSNPTRLQLAIQNIEKARAYTRQLLEGLDDADWFRQPTEGVTHVAWQVGHLAMAQYALCLARRRGSEPGDRDLMSREFRRHFGKGSIPDPDPANNPSPEEIRQVFDAVHRQSLAELAAEDDARLAEPLAAPHEMFNTLIEALEFCALHEMLHAGQIGLLRRLLGSEPLR